MGVQRSHAMHERGPSDLALQNFLRFDNWGDPEKTLVGLLGPRRHDGSLIRQLERTSCPYAQQNKYYA